MKILIYYFCFCFPLLMLSQNPIYAKNSAKHKLDSLKGLIIKNRIDTTQMWLLQDIADLSVDQNDSSAFFCNQSIAIAQSLGHVEGELYGKITLAQAYWEKDILTSIKLCMEVIRTAKNKLKDPRTILMITYFNLGALNKFLVNYKQAILQYNLSKYFALQLNKISWVAACSREIGGAYGYLNQIDSCEYYLDMAVNENPKEQTYALYWAYKSNIEKNRNPNLALEYLIHSTKIATEDNASRLISFGKSRISQFYLDHLVLDSAITSAKEGLQISQSINNIRNIYIVSQILSKSYALKNMIDSAYKYQSLMLAAQDSIYSVDKLNRIQSMYLEEQVNIQKLEADNLDQKNKLKQYAFIFAIGLLAIFGLVLYKGNRQKQKTNNLLNVQINKVEETLIELKSTQALLIQSEKMASLGELTAGIAHEIQNPLNFVNNFSEVNGELIKEMLEERSKKPEERSDKLQDELIENINENSEKINHHGKRAESIVKGMLEHSRKSTGIKEAKDINKLCDEFVRLSYQGIRAKDNKFNVDYKLDLDPNLPNVNVIPQDMGRVLLNVINNAFQACAERSYSAWAVQQARANIENRNEYKPMVTITTHFYAPLHRCEIIVSDNGPGIPDSIKDKIFQPFFTTKPTGQGTGLGLSLAYDIIKAHSGTIEAKSIDGAGSEFIILLPV